MDASPFYLLSLLFFALGLMSKPMLVTLPFVLLLLDYWPLARFELQTSDQRLKTVLWEKVPFFVLTLASSVVTFLVQQNAGAVAEAGALPLDLRLQNAVTSCFLYLSRTVWPSGLAIFYPYRHHIPTALFLCALLTILVISGVAFRRRQEQPYLAVGWCWFLGMLVPVIGIVQVGQQALADRYTYLPLVGLFIALTWAAADLISGWVTHPALARRIAAGAALGVSAACLFLTFTQAQHWKNSETLFTHTLAVTQDNALAHHSLGDDLVRHGKFEEAERHFMEAVRLDPRHPAALSDLGVIRVMQGKPAEGINLYRASLALKPGDWKTHNNLARALCLEGKFDEAVAAFRTALELNPGATDTRGYLAAALVELGKTNEASAVFEQALQLNPADAAAHFKYASLLMALGQADAAATQFQAALRYDPGNSEAHRRFGLLLLDQGKAPEAVEQFREAIRLQPNAEAHFNLASVLSQQGQTAAAVAEYRESLKLAPDSPIVLNNLAWILAANPDSQIRNGTDAVQFAERACRLTEFRQPMFIGTLAAAHAEAGQFEKAVQAAEQAIAAASAAGQKELAERNRQLLALYRAGKPFHE